MQPFWEIVASNALLVVVLAAGVALLGRVWKNPLCLHLLWVFVLLKLITPPVATVPIVLPARQAQPAPEARMADQRLAHPSHVDASQQEIASITMDQELQPLANDREVSQNPAQNISNVPPLAEYHGLPWLTVVEWVWGMGIVLFASVHAYRILRFRRLFHSSQPPSFAVLSTAERAAKRLGLGRVPQVRMLPVCVSPLVWSLGGRPKVFLPAALFERLDASAQEAILTHELAHVRRKDHWVRLLEVTITTLFWWHPVVWWAARRLQELEDQCCDAMVVDMAPHGAKSYAIALLDTLDFLCERSIAAPLSATAAKSSISLTRRIAMLKNRSWTARLTFGRLMLLLTVAAFPMALAFGQKSPEATDKTPSSGSVSPLPTAQSPLPQAADGTPRVFVEMKVMDVPRTWDLVRRLPNGSVILSEAEAKKLIETAQNDRHANILQAPRLLAPLGNEVEMQTVWRGHAVLVCQVLAETGKGKGTIALRIKPDLASREKQKARTPIQVERPEQWRTNIQAELKRGEAVVFGGWDDAHSEPRSSDLVTVFVVQASYAEPAESSEQPTVQRRAIHKLVKDFPEKTDLSTPESAMVAWWRNLARKDIPAVLELSWVKLDAQTAKEVEQALKNDPAAPKNFSQQVLNTEIIEVLTYQDDFAVVIYKSSLPNEDPCNWQLVGRINGMWRGLSLETSLNHPFQSVQAATESFEKKKEDFWRQFVELRNDVKNGRTPKFSVGEGKHADHNLTFKNDTGWIWHIKPEPAHWTAMATRGLVLRMDELKNDRLLLTLARSRESTRDAVEFQPVAFDASGKRFAFTAASGGGVEGVDLKGFEFDLKSLPRDQIKFIGVEKLTKDNLRDVVAPAAFQKLKEAHVNALPFPRLGEHYEFELRTIDGKKLSSTDLRGKVVLLDFWSTWCGPCMVKMPKLKQTYQRLASRGFEVIGLNHDRTLEEAKRAIAKQELPWPNVLAPADQREFWFAATGTGPLPRLLLLDRDGILRADVSPHDLDAEIEKLISKP